MSDDVKQMGWHFLRADKRLRYGDGRRARVGVKQQYRDGKIRKRRRIELCERGMHGSVRLIDALDHASGPILTWCEFGGEIIHGHDKFVAEWRRVVWMGDVLDVLKAWVLAEIRRLPADTRFDIVDELNNGHVFFCADRAAYAARQAGVSAAANRRLEARVRRLMRA